MQNTTERKKRSQSGQGRLYKRSRDGKEHPANSKVRGVFWFSYYAKGHRVRQKLLHENGTSVTSLRDAEKIQKNIIASLAANSREKQLRSIQNQLAEVEESQSKKLPAMKLSDVWNAYSRSHNRPSSGARTLSGYKSQFDSFVEWISSVSIPIVSLSRKSVFRCR